MRQNLPDVPNRLREAARSLLDQQEKLARVAQTTGEIATLVKQRVVNALSAIQIGDIARQRIEHVLAACRMAGDALRTAEEAAGGAAGDSGTDEARFAGTHILRLSRAQLESIRVEFAQEAGQLLESLSELVPQSLKLLDFVKSNSTISQSAVFIGTLEEAIGQTCSLTDRLRLADEEASSILRSAMATVEAVSTRVDRVQHLGLDVGYMSINATLRCRRNTAISRPISVIAREIKSHSGLINQHTVTVVRLSTQLQELSLRISGLGGAGLDSVASVLDGSLASLRDAADDTAAGIERVGVNASGLADKIGQTIEDLRASLGIVEAIGTVISDLELICDDAVPDGPVTPDHPLWAMMDQLKAIYTMASEREVHNRLLLGEMAGCNVDTMSVVSDLSDDDLFDDALF